MNRKAAPSTRRPKAPERFPILYMDLKDVDEFKQNMVLPGALDNDAAYHRIFQQGMEITDLESGRRALMVPRAKRDGDPSWISGRDLDALALGR
ncbi:hypothetical protein pkur_cds_246 [Pandoravirus kuranda]|uniref:Uncharacterized protein n=2 Tax=Pandoravirus TaxID=2060084 RepID=A0AA95ECA4_9VIRU|nr:hypothetical protein pneo_cds_272 [Pandoravirus neocaledonia]AVK75879.1 hypothetical protein pneo_cds_272 [Pandoravirus neocaledonia]WBR14421.1 hypothetical protein pkur_cds_246 [Pandoravirus kuranda]